jgi:hypothetical protein
MGLLDYGRDIGSGGRPREASGIHVRAVQRLAVLAQRYRSDTNLASKDADGSLRRIQLDRADDLVGLRRTCRRRAFSAASPDNDREARTEREETRFTAPDHPMHVHRVLPSACEPAIQKYRPPLRRDTDSRPSSLPTDMG